MPRCCPECFDDRGLRKSIFPSLRPVLGQCEICGSDNVSLVESTQLAPHFGLLVGIYELDPAGKPLVEWMRDDWQLFGRLDNANAQVLLGEILDDGEFVRQTFVPSATYRSDAIAQWETLRDELMHKNRYFLDEALDFDRLKELLDHLPADDMPATWYRARIRSDQVNYPIDKMGAPPKELAPGGRANPPGIPYLYLGSTTATAVAEVRPHAGEVVCVADFTIADAWKAVDLRNPRKLVSPFLLASAGAIGQLRADIPFLERLGEELTRPVLPQGAAIDYLPSQYLCEFIKKSGYDGVVYRSSIDAAAGMNLALFDPAKAIGENVAAHKVMRVSVTTERA